MAAHLRIKPCQEGGSRMDAQSKADGLERLPDAVVTETEPLPDLLVPVSLDEGHDRFDPSGTRQIRPSQDFHAPVLKT